MGLAEQYKNALSHKFGSDVAVFDYAADFDKFWFEGPDTIPAPEIAVAASTTTKKALIIVWDGMPNDKSNNGELLAPHLTPLDWTLAFALRMLELEKVDRADFSIHIIDLTVNAYEDAFVSRMRDTLLAEMPWVKLYAPLVPKDINGRNVRCRRGYKNIADLINVNTQSPLLLLPTDVLTMANSIKGQEGSVKHALSIVANAWRSSIVQSDDHHDLNNIIGPDIIVPTNDSYIGLMGAILRKLFWCEQSEARGHFHIDWQFSPEDLFGKHLSVVIIDDCLNDGWDRFVCKLMGANYANPRPQSDISGYERINDEHDTINIYGATKIDAVIKKLQSIDFSKRNFRSGLLNKEGGIELVFLDLRLFQSLSDAKTYTQQLIEIANQRCASGLAWPGFKHGELQEISDWCKGKINDDNNRSSDSALTLLPRLLALAFPLTPIVLFSSTGQARLKEKLKPYRNVITGFEKPRVLSSSELVRESLAILHDSLDQSMDILRLKLQLSEAQNNIDKISIERKLFTDSQPAHLEVYVDETANVDNGIISALALCFYPKKSDAERLQERFINEFNLPVGVRKTVWAKSGDADNSCLPKGNKLYRSDIGLNNLTAIAPVNSVVTSICPDTCRWSAVTIRVPGGKAPDLNVNAPTLRDFRDATLDQALRFGLEFSIYALLPYLVEDNSGLPLSVDLHMPQRSCPVWIDDPAYSANTYLKSKKYAEKVSRAFSVSWSEWIDDSGLNKVLFRTFESTERDENTRKIRRGNSYFPLIRAWLSEWQDTGAHQITGIYAVDLTKGTEKILSDAEASERRLFHDIADWVATGARSHEVQNALSPIFPNWYKTFRDDINWYKTFRDDFNDANSLMKALKLAETQPIDNRTGRADCLRFILLNSSVFKCSDAISKIEAVLLWALKDEIGYADGEDLFKVILYQRRNAHPDNMSKDVIEASDQVLPVTDVVLETDIQELHTEVLADSESIKISQEKIEESEPSESPHVEELPVIEFADLVWLRQRFPDGIELLVQKVTKHGSVLCKLPEENDITHQCDSKALADTLRGKGVSAPTKIFAIPIKHESSQSGLGDEDMLLADHRNVPFNAKAVLLADDRWQIL